MRSGPGLGGNKTRKLEYLLADAQHRGARKVVTFGGLQSNHARLTAAAACQLGLEPHLFYFERRPPRLTGNLLLNQLLGAQHALHPLRRRRRRGMTLEADHPPGAPGGLAHAWGGITSSRWAGTTGWAAWATCARRSRSTAGARTLGIERCQAGDRGRLGRHPGRADGRAGAVGSQLRPAGHRRGQAVEGFPGLHRPPGRARCARVWGNPTPSAEAQVPLIEGTYVGPGYGVRSQAADAAIRRLAESEGILLDPVYTGKAFAGMLDLCQRGTLSAERAAHLPAHRRLAGAVRGLSEGPTANTTRTYLASYTSDSSTCALGATSRTLSRMSSRCSWTRTGPTPEGA